MKYRNFVEWFIPEHIKDNPGEYMRAKLLVGLTFPVVLGILTFGPLLYTYHVRMGLAVLIIGSILILSPLMMKMLGSVKISGNILVGGFYLLFTYIMIMTGGLSSPNNSALPILPIIALLTLGWKMGIFWTVVLLGTIGTIYGQTLSGQSFPLLELSFEDQKEFEFIMTTGNVFVVMLFVLVFENIRQNQSKIIFNLLNNLSSTSQQLSQLANHLTPNSEKLAQGALEQAASLEETSSSMEQIASQTRENADNASSSSVSIEEVAEMVNQSTENAISAASLSKDASDSMKDGVTTMENIASAMKEIREGSEQITSIIEVINEIAHQTKMLATNAAIEAARAGEQGKGFAVVADEVSKLAENSKGAAKEITALIKNSTLKAQNGSELAEKGENVLKRLFEKSTNVAQLVNEISSFSREQAEKVSNVKFLMESIKTASLEQSNGMDLVSQAIATIDQVTQSNASGAEDAANMAKDLATQAELLHSLVQQVHWDMGLKTTHEEMLNKSYENQIVAVKSHDPIAPNPYLTSQVRGNFKDF